MGYLIEIVNSLLEVFIVLFFFNQVLSKKDQSIKIKVLVIGAVTVIHVIRSFIPFNTYTNFAITFILWGVLLILLYDSSIHKKLIVLLVYFVVVIMCDILCRVITDNILGLPYDAISLVGLQRYIFMIIYVLLYFTILSLIALVIKHKKNTLSTKYWIMMMLFPLFSLFIIICLDKLLILAQIDNINYILLLMIIIIGLLYFNIVVFDFIDTYSAKLQLQASEKLIEAQTQNYKLLEINEKELRVLQHNINNHLEIIQNMIANKSIEESTTLFKSIQKLSAESLNTVYTSDIALDSILNIEAKKAAEKDIKYTVKAHQITEPLNIDSVDKSNILCNAIDNAIEAAEKTNEKFVIVNIASDKQYIKITVENSSLPVKIQNNSIVTSKRDNKLHGIGISSIKDTIKKYDGIMNLSYSNGIFRCILLINNTKSM